MAINRLGSKRTGRLLAQHELELWSQVTRHVKPMPGKRHSRQTHIGQQSQPERALECDVPAFPPVTSAKKPEIRIKPLAPLEAKVLRKLARGHDDPDVRIDLHGMRQAEAHQRLRNFLLNAHANGCRVALVVTGKGSGDSPVFLHEERGILKRILPHWLAAPDLRHIVLGFREASRRHGGAGAYYVRLRASVSARIRYKL